MKCIARDRHGNNCENESDGCDFCLVCVPPLPIRQAQHEEYCARWFPTTCPCGQPIVKSTPWHESRIQTGRGEVRARHPVFSWCRPCLATEIASGHEYIARLAGHADSARRKYEASQDLADRHAWNNQAGLWNCQREIVQAKEEALESAEWLAAHMPELS